VRRTSSTVRSVLYPRWTRLNDLVRVNRARRDAGASYAVDGERRCRAEVALWLLVFAGCTSFGEGALRHLVRRGRRHGGRSSHDGAPLPSHP